MSILERIAAYKRDEVARRRAAVDPAAWAERLCAAPTPRGFFATLQGRSAIGRPALIGEIKKASPSKGLICVQFDPPALARAYAEGGAACLSVLTDGPSFQGADADLAAARQAVGLPVLRKDFLIDPWQVGEARAIGADAVLVILALVDDSLAATLIGEAARLSMDALVEVHDEAEMARAGALGARLIGINNRDLATFVTSLATFERLAPFAPSGALIVAESGIAGPADVARMAAAGAGALLIGESLMRAPDLALAARKLFDY